MILRQPASLTRRRSAFTLLEVLVVVAIILVLASVSTVAVLQIREDNKSDIAKITATSLANSVKIYVNKKGERPGSLEDVLQFVDGNDPSKLIDPWNQPYQIGEQDNGTGVINYFVFTVHPKTGEQIRSDSKSK